MDKSGYGYYPVGADTDDAPWNKESIEPKEFYVVCSQTLSKCGNKVLTDDYELDDTKIDTNYTNWERAYNEEHLTPLELIEKLKEICTNYYVRGNLTQDSEELKYLINECQNWLVDDLEFMEDSDEID